MSIIFHPQDVVSVCDGGENVVSVRYSIAPATVQRRVVIRIEDYGKKTMFRITGWQLSTLELPTDYAVVKRSGTGYDLLPLFQ